MFPDSGPEQARPTLRHCEHFGSFRSHYNEGSIGLELRLVARWIPILTLILLMRHCWHFLLFLPDLDDHILIVLKLQSVIGLTVVKDALVANACSRLTNAPQVGV